MSFWESIQSTELENNEYKNEAINQTDEALKILNYFREEYGVNSKEFINVKKEYDELKEKTRLIFQSNSKITKIEIESLKKEFEDIKDLESYGDYLDRKSNEIKYWKIANYLDNIIKSSSTYEISNNLESILDYSLFLSDKIIKEIKNIISILKIDGLTLEARNIMLLNITNMISKEVNLSFINKLQEKLILKVLNNWYKEYSRSHIQWFNGEKGWNYIKNISVFEWEIKEKNIEDINSRELANYLMYLYEFKSWENKVEFSKLLIKKIWKEKTNSLLKIWSENTDSIAQNLLTHSWFWDIINIINYYSNTNNNTITKVKAEEISNENLEIIWTISKYEVISRLRIELEKSGISEEKIKEKLSYLTWEEVDTSLLINTNNSFFQSINRIIWTKKENIAKKDIISLGNNDETLIIKTLIDNIDKVDDLKIYLLNDINKLNNFIKKLPESCPTSTEITKFITDIKQIHLNLIKESFKNIKWFKTPEWKSAEAWLTELINKPWVCWYDLNKFLNNLIWPDWKKLSIEQQSNILQNKVQLEEIKEKLVLKQYNIKFSEIQGFTEEEIINYINSLKWNNLTKDKRNILLKIIKNKQNFNARTSSYIKKDWTIDFITFTEDLIESESKEDFIQKNKKRLEEKQKLEKIQEKTKIIESWPPSKLKHINNTEKYILIEWIIPILKSPIDWKEITITNEEAEKIKNNPEALENLVNFNKFFTELGLWSIWKYRKELINSIWDININFMDSNSLSKSELINFWNNLLKWINNLIQNNNKLKEKILLKTNSNSLSWIRNELRKFSWNNWLLSDEKTHNIEWEDKFEATLRSFWIIWWAYFKTNLFREMIK